MPYMPSDLYISCELNEEYEHVWHYHDDGLTVFIWKNKDVERDHTDALKVVKDVTPFDRPKCSECGRSNIHEKECTRKAA
jgi:hypothetical protein